MHGSDKNGDGKGRTAEQGHIAGERGLERQGSNAGYAAQRLNGNSYSESQHQRDPRERDQLMRGGLQNVAGGNRAGCNAAGTRGEERGRSVAVFEHGAQRSEKPRDQRERHRERERRFNEEEGEAQYGGWNRQQQPAD